ncbi:GH32 C-terminal domain-containing protein [Zongyangia hominis]|uniref:GH32 C-terminal domain-containing protein n=1 Tax=Zongyangia hominis TaxID=2763677 RepID=A0A926EB84_9FIRM|nr:GH32 C-terminal domain-containing protein [Zongyangia hominis]MBC8569845.1 GH32 C-terminal domain-containing protein [Zongyangia hominis]
MKRVKRSLCLVFALVFALMSVIPAGFMTVSAAETAELAGWGGQHTYENGVLTVKNANIGNNYVASTTQATAFTLEADMKYLNGANADAGILFGAPQQEMESAASGWYGAMVNDKKARVFCERGADALNAILDIPNPDTVDPTKLKIKLTVDAEKNIYFYVNDMDTPVITTSAPNFKGGYVGFVAYNKDVEFSNIKFMDDSGSVTPPPEGNFVTNIEGDWKASGGSWTETENGMYAANLGLGDTFYMSSLNVPASQTFVVEGDMTFSQVNVAAGLVFGVKNPDNPKSYWYCVNVDKNSKIAKLFKNTGGENWNISKNLDEEEMKKDSFHLRVEVLENGVFNFYLDGQYVGTKQDTEFEGGYVGVMTCGANATFQNINYTPAVTPKLIGLEVKGLTLNETFNDQIFLYTAEVPYTQESFQVKATTDGAHKLFINDKEAVNGQLSDPIALESGYNDVLIKVLDEATGVASVTTIKVKKASDPSVAFQEDYRPQFHFSPEYNWINDPNGLMYNASTGEYNMYFQHNPYGTAWGNMSWGHAVSKDLISWTEMPVTMTPDELGAIFSGCGVIDRNNTCGLFDESTPPDERMVAIFTHDGGDTTYGVEKQSLAYSTDNGRSWIKYDHNPVLSGAGINNGFRDPQVWWQEDSSYDAGGVWLMIVAGGDARLYSSSNLINWTLESDLYYSGTNNRINSECPGLYPLKVEGTNETKWVYNGSGKWYIVGDLVKENGKYQFKSLTGQITYNGGPDMYATQKYFNDPKGRTLLVSWMQESAMNGKDWTGAQSLPLVTGLKMINGQYRLTSYAPEEINEYRSETPIFETNDLTVGANNGNILEGLAGQKYDIEATIDPGDATQFGFNLRKGGNNQITVKYDVNGNRLYVDKSKSGGPSKNENCSYELYQTADGKIKLRIIVDWSIIDVFGNDGEAAIDTIYYTALDNAGMEFFTDGNLTIDSLKIWDMKSMYRDDITTPDGNPTSLLLSAPATVGVNEEFKVTANVLPNGAKDKSVTWTCGEGLTIVEQTDTYLKLRASAEGDYTIKAVTNSGGLEKEVTVSVVKKEFNTNLSGWTTSAGNWEVVEDGYRVVGSGDNFAVAEQYVSGDFVYEGDVMLEDGQALGLIFRATDTIINTAGGYVLNFDMAQKNFRIFEFPKGGGGARDVMNIKFADAGVQPKLGSWHHYKVEAKGDTYTVTFDDKVLTEGKVDTGSVREGRVGVMVYSGTAKFNNVYLTTGSPIKSIVSKIDDIIVKIGTAADDVLYRLPAKVLAEQEDGVQISVDVAWDLSGVNLNKEGTYKAVGTLEGTDVKAYANIIVNESGEAVLESLTPAQLKVSAKVGSKPEDVFAKLQKKVVANYSDGRKVDMTVSGWNYDNVDFNKVGTYDAIGYLSVDGEQVDVTIPIKVTITKDGGGKPNIPGGNNSDWKWPSGSGSDSSNSGKKNPNSGDNSALPIALAILAVSAGAVVILRRKK